jgi:hypothetical protein
MANTGNLPPKSTPNDASQFFNNFNNTALNVSQNVDDAVIGFFESITGDSQAARVLASTVLYTALTQGLDPMTFVDELKALKSGKRIEHKTPIDRVQVISTYLTYQQIVNNKELYEEGQLFYIPATNVFCKLLMVEGLLTVVSITGFKADAVLVSGTTEYNYFAVSYTQEKNELNAYLTMLLNLNRVNTSLLGISNSPQTNKYIARAILP